MQEIPEDILSKPTDQILAFLAELGKSGSRTKWGTIKLVLVGREGAGKTSLLRCLTDSGRAQKAKGKSVKDKTKAVDQILKSSNAGDESPSTVSTDGIDISLLAIMVPGTTAGVGLGWATAHLVPEPLVTGLVGLIGAVFAANLLLRHSPAADPRPGRVAPGLFWGVVTGFTSFVSHAGAPPYQVYTMPLGLRKEVYAGTATIAFAYVNAIKLVPYWALGQINLANLRVAAMLAIPAALAVFAGVRLVKRLPERLFVQMVTWALLLLSLKLLWQGIGALI